MRGFTKLENEHLFSTELTPYSKLVLASITYYTRNGKGQCFAKKTTLARMIGISLYHLRISLKELEELRIIKITRRGQGNTDVIEINSEVENVEVCKPRVETASNKPSSIIGRRNNLEEEKAVSNQNLEVLEAEKPKHTEEPVSLCGDRDENACDDQGAIKPLQPLPEYQDENEALVASLRRSMRPASFYSFISGKVCISFSNEDKMLLTCVDTHTAYWLKQSYKSLFDKITGKKCEFLEQ